MTPAAHISISYLSGRILKKLPAATIIIGGVMPDIDYIFFHARFFNEIHRVVTHNLLFIIIISLIGFLFCREKRKPAVFAGLFLGGLLHLFFDACLDSNPSNGTGVAILWPFYSGFFSPVNICDFFDIETRIIGWEDPLARIRAGFKMMIWEAPLYLLSIIIYFKSDKNKIKSGRNNSC